MKDGRSSNISNDSNLVTRVTKEQRDTWIPKLAMLAFFLLVLGPWVFGFLAWKWVFAQTVSLTSPTSTTCWVPGTTQTITWTMSGLDHLALNYTTDGTELHYPSANIAHPTNSGALSYSWPIPGAIDSSTVKITADGHTGPHDNATFTTSPNFKISPLCNPPTISSVASSNIGQNSATITWTTDQSSTSYVDYGTTDSYGSTAGQADSVTSHTVNLSGLSVGTQYHYRVRSKNASPYDKESTSGDFHFTTQSPPPPPPPPPGCSCGAWSEWKNGACGGGSCSSEKRNQYRTRSCSPAGCDLEIQGQCVEDSACLPPPPPPPPPSPEEPVMYEISVEEIKVGGERIDPEDVAKVEEGETIELSGTTTPNSTVFIFVTSETRIYTAGADDTGNWVYAIHTSEFEPGIHVVEVQSEKDEARSARLKIFSFEVLAAEEVPIEPQVGKVPYQWVILGIAGLSALAVVGYLLLRRKRV